MTCPTCNGPMAHLFTSSYCPACDERRAKYEANVEAFKQVKAPVPVNEWSCIEMPAGWSAWLDYYIDLVDQHSHGPGIPAAILYGCGDD